MTKEKLILVMGPASSGTRMMEAIVKKVGYTGSPAVHAFNWLGLPSDKVVWRRSFPHGGLGNRYWPGIVAMADKGKHSGYQVYGIFIYRSPLITALSQHKNGHNVGPRASFEDVKRAVVEIPKGFDEAGIPWCPVFYDEFVKFPRAIMKNIALTLNLPEFDVECPLDLYDGNEKYRKRLNELDIE